MDRRADVLRALRETGGLSVREASRLDCFSALTPASAYPAAWDVLRLLAIDGLARRPFRNGGKWTAKAEVAEVVEPVMVTVTPLPPPPPPWSLEELRAWLCGLRSAVADQSAAGLARVASSLDPAAVIRACEAVRLAIEERDGRRKGTPTNSEDFHGDSTPRRGRQAEIG